MCGNAGDMKIEAAPLMSQLQRTFLDQYIRGVANQMQGFTLGQPWMGPSYSSYSPTVFSPHGGFSDFQKIPSGGGGRENGGKDDNVIYKDEMAPGRRKKKKINRGELRTSDMGVAPLLASMAPMGQAGQTGQAGDWTGVFQPTPLYSNPLTQLLTSPFVSPFQYGMTGNYPKRG